MAFELRKGGINPTPTDFVRPDPPPAFLPAQPGTMIVRYGGEVVTLDPTSPPEKFHADRERMNDLLMKIDRDYFKGHR